VYNRIIRTMEKGDVSTMDIAVLFPGIGYTCDRPLLYYAAKAAAARGRAVVRLSFSGFPAGVKGDADKMAAALALAYGQAEEALRDTDFGAYGRVMFIGKSIGTAVAARYAHEHGVHARMALLTPLAETFAVPVVDAVAFHGTADPWADTPAIRRACAAQGIPLRLTEGANHSLETGDVMRDLETLCATVRAIDAMLRG